MPKARESELAICPYYQHEKYSKIYCEGHIPGANTCQTFKEMQTFKAWKDEYCYSHNYERCPHCKTLEAKYNE